MRHDEGSWSEGMSFIWLGRFVPSELSPMGNLESILCTGECL